MAGFRLDQAKGKQREITEKVETKKNELKDLEANKQELLEAGTDVQASDMEEDTKKKIMELINSGLNEIAEKGDNLADDMNQEIQDLESLKVDTMEALESNYTESEKIQRRKEMLDKIGLGGSLDSSISELQDNQTTLDEFNASLIENQKEAMDISQQLGML